MSLLVAPDAWPERRRIAAGTLAPLADGIARDLEPVLARPLYIPSEKALMSREGGRCARDGALLEFDPFDREHHRCPVCAGTYTNEWHRRFWPYWYQLWLAERAVHAAALHALRGEARHRAFAESVLAGYADLYLEYPVADSVLGPSRPFFSTYLESIWLLQLCIALDLLEHEAPSGSLGARVRERIIEPSVTLIASFDEGTSNRQVWNVAAQMAAGYVLGRRDAAESQVRAPHGLVYLLRHALLEDGSWYEGENYHLFAHRGLWYGMTMAGSAGIELDMHLRAPFMRGFVTPLFTALPDYTLPSRRDSQYAISLRQPRFAESCELGLAYTGREPLLAGALRRLYDAPDPVPSADNGRSRTAADVERNLPAMRLSRADLSWRTLLFGTEHLPDGDVQEPSSALLPQQGIAVLRRRKGRVYAALDYGHSGGGHGHPDRLNVLLMDGDRRWLDDMGTGSYVDRSLHWYRSTLAHNAPLVDGQSQAAVDGRLLAYDDDGTAGWVRGIADGIAEGIRFTRTIVATEHAVVEELAWVAVRDVCVDLPYHAPLEAEILDWTPASIAGGTGLEDGFEFLRDGARRASAAGDVIALRAPDAPMRAWITADSPAEWWRLTAPSAPGKGDHTFHLVRIRGRRGRIRSVWSWAGASQVRFDTDAIELQFADGTERHLAAEDDWHVERSSPEGTERSVLRGALGYLPPRLPTVPASVEREPIARLRVGDYIVQLLGERDYRRSEQSWSEAGRPTGAVRISWDGRHLGVRIRVDKPQPIVFVPAGAENPLDNEPAEINGDGVQLYVRVGDLRGGWIIVPVSESSDARAVAVRGWNGLVLAHVTWEPTATGYAIDAQVPVAAATTQLELGVAVNETTPGRARRRGQLVLGGAAGEWVYLRGDRMDADRLLPIRLLSGDLS